MTDRFCMECGAEHPSLAAAAREANAAAAPAASIENTTPTLSPSNDTERPQEGDTIACPKCGSKLPRGARFCGDCGAALANAAGAVPAARQASVAAALPAPIPPLHANEAAKPASGPAQPVLPPFRAANWPEQPAPQPAQQAKAPEVDDEAPTHLVSEPAPAPTAQPAAAWVSPPAPVVQPPMPALANQPAPPNGPAPAWVNAPAAPNGQAAAPAWAKPPEPPAWGAPQAPAWQPGTLQTNSKAAEFSAPHPYPPGPMPAAPVQGAVPPQPAATSNPSQAFVQAISAMPMAPALPGMRAPATRTRQRYPRGQVITMIVAAIVTVMSALGGVIVLLLSNK